MKKFNLMTEKQMTKADGGSIILAVAGCAGGAIAAGAAIGATSHKF